MNRWFMKWPLLSSTNIHLKLGEQLNCYTVWLHRNCKLSDNLDKREGLGVTICLSAAFWFLIFLLSVFKPCLESVPRCDIWGHSQTRIVSGGTFSEWASQKHRLIIWTRNVDPPCQTIVLWDFSTSVHPSSCDSNTFIYVMVNVYVKRSMFFFLFVSLFFLNVAGELIVTSLSIDRKIHLKPPHWCYIEPLSRRLNV